MRLTPSRIVYIFLSATVLVLLVQSLLSISNGFFSKAGQSVTISLDEIKQRMADRLDQVRQVCAKYNIHAESVNNAGYSIPHPPVPQYGVLYYQLQKKMVYCPIYKAASTSMLHWLLKIKGLDASHAVKITRRQISDIAREHYPSLDYPAAAELMKDAKRWMVVRHPFERILSAYRDKLENSTAGREHGTLHFYEKYGRKIVSKYRTGSSKRLEPTFSEFVDYLVDTDLTLYADDHWIPYYLFCTPCLIDYDVIIHFETMQDDVRMLLDLIGEKTGPLVQHSTSDGRSRLELVRAYYGQLSADAITNLYEKYKVDFQLFGYTIQDYLP